MIIKPQFKRKIQIIDFKNENIQNIEEPKNINKFKSIKIDEN